jgi:glycerophosphoryl diester phosphodiesterase
MKKMKRRFIVASLLGIVVLFLAIGPKPQFERVNPFMAVDGKTLVMAHAGGKGVYPDNTMKAYQYAFDLGVDVLEMDLQMTLDGILVLSHGENVTGNTRQHSNCETFIWKETYQYLYDNCNFAYTYQESDGSYLYRDFTQARVITEKVYVPTLEEVFLTFGKNTLYNIEIKADGDAPRNEVANQLYELITTYDLIDHVLVATAFDDISEHLLTNYSDLYISTSLGAARTWIIGMYTMTSITLGRPLYAAIQVPTSYGFPVIETLDRKSVV